MYEIMDSIGGRRLLFYMNDVFCRVGLLVHASAYHLINDKNEFMILDDHEFAETRSSCRQ
jgi:hypothetical protein